MNSFKNIIEFELFSIGEYSLNLGKVLDLGIIILITLLVLWFIKKFLYKIKQNNIYNTERLYSLFQIVKYVIWITSILIGLETLGIKINAILAGSAALLVGVGLGLQNTFNDFISGLILLFEGSIKIDDILEVDGDLVKIKKIGLRTSEAINRDDIVVIMPNSIITTSKVINWSHQSKKTRFKIKIGVAYGSDVELVERLLEESAKEHQEIDKRAKIISRFIDFGNSSLDFELLFYSSKIFSIEDIKSDIRKNINRKFTENKISIPFPQMDLHLKKEE